ncbi:hypothetical protein G6F68_002725 [Rhizopus microsporus]|nr:hypothetical protein G6F67_003460 [Rhizopus microsporus]KAG1266488.1 hypothetical protein G6F68_002725 [Rhizopus microsporus]
MFYVRGKYFLSSFSDPTTLDQIEEGDSISSLQELLTPSIVIHCFITAVDILPTFLLAASFMSILAYLYSILLLPLVTTLPVDPIVNISVPLDIGCPLLKPRSTPAQSVHDLRPDDIKIVAGLGDSVMAGFAAKGVQERFLNIQNLYENRGVSFALGGDPDTITMPNILHYYSHNLYGASVGDHLISICFGNQICPKGQYREDIDILNAAQSGARSLNLDHELDYIMDVLQKAYDDNKVKPTDWKLITIFIGSNDICHSCTEPTSLPVSFAANVQTAIERIRKSMSHVLVQIIGIMKVQDIVVATSNYTDYCRPIKGSNFIGHDHECECSHSEANRTIMNTLFPEYNAALLQAVNYYRQPPSNAFAVVYQPLLVDIMSFPIQAISNIDCFHPSTLAHSWFAKMLWRMMFLPPNEKNMMLKYDASAPIYCPNENDRIQTL